MIIAKQAERETGRAYALRTLRENIIETELKPGTMLSEKELADEMALSRTPVREAIIELANMQIIEVLPQRGSRIALIDMDVVEESSFFRMTMEIAVAKLACKKATPEDFIEIEGILKLQDFYLQSNAPNRLLESDNQFHKSLFQICNKMKCYELVTNMSIHFDRIRRLALNTVKDLKIVEDHWNIYHAIHDNDEEKAEALITHHLTRFHVDERGIRESYPDYFK